MMPLRLLRHSCAITGLVAATLGHAAVTGYSDQTAFAAAAGPLAVETFEGFATGTTVASLPSLAIASLSGLDHFGTPVSQMIGSSSALPFPMFAPPLPSGTQFLSNDLDSPSYATGEITFTFDATATAIGAYVADSAPLGGFSIEVFNGAMSLGVISVGPRTLPDSFVGIVSSMAFTSAKFYANTSGDSWGLDDLQVSAVPEPESYALMLGGLALIGFARYCRR